VLAVDADAGLANLDVLLGVTPSGHVGQLLDGAELESVLARSAAGVTVLPGSPGERRLVHLAPADRRTLVAVWNELATRFDVVVVDAGPGVGDDTLFFSATGQRVLVVVTEEPTSLADAAVLIVSLCRRAGVRQVDVVVNGVRTSRSAQSVFSRLQAVVASEPVRLSFLAHVPDDQNVRRAAMLRRPLVEVAPTSPAARAFERIAVQVLEGPVVSPGRVSIGLEQQLGVLPPPLRTVS
jgi:flagellar biosynthesis protein FlhG